MISYNCSCDDSANRSTLAELRRRLMVRLGFAAQATNPPPGMKELLNDFLQSAQVALYRRPTGEFRTERFFSWPLEEGVRLYDFPENAEQYEDDECLKTINPHQVTWVGTVRDGVWTPLLQGIPPQLYTTDDITGRPTRYEFRQCIELWPAPEESRGDLVIKGRFELEPFEDDEDKTTIDSEMVFLLALSNAKQHYRQADAQSYIQQLEVMIANMVAGTHGTRRYMPGLPVHRECVYVPPRPEVPFE